MHEITSNHSKILIAQELLKEAVLSGKVLDFTVSSDSMLPLLPEHSIVTVAHTPLETLKKGDILIVQLYGDFIVHRLVYQLKNASTLSFLTKGDNRLKCDQIPITQKEFIGKVIRIRKNGKMVNMEISKVQMLNALLANLSYIQARAFQHTLSFKKHVFGNRLIGLRRTIKPAIYTILLFPNRLIARLAAWLIRS